MSPETQAAPREQQRPEYLQFSPNHITGLQARLALGGDALNPAMAFDRQITPDMVADLQDRDLSKVIAAVTKAGSSPGRTSPSASEWATKYGALLNTSDNTRDRNNTLKLFLNTATGIELSTDNGATVAQAIHRRYFQTDKAIELNHGTHTKKYHAVDLNLVVEDILKGYTVDNKLNYDRLRDDRLPIMWFLKIFPKGSDEIIWALIDEEAKRRAKPDVFYRDINVEVQVTENGRHKNVRRFEPDALTAYEKKTLERIWDGTEAEITQTQRPPVSRPEPPTQLPPENLPDPSEQQPLEAGRAYNVVDIYRAIPHPPSEKNPYFIGHVPDILNITEDEIQNLLTVEPFFLVRPGTQGGIYREVNGAVAPYARKLEIDLKDKRYIATEKATNNDSGVFALCAASAGTPEEQAKLFHHVANEIVGIHHASPILLHRWLENQHNDQATGYKAHTIFQHYDQQRPEEERLFVEGSSPNDIIESTKRKWYPIIDNLQTKLDRNEPLTSLDLRHIEFLAHSIRVADLMSLIKGRSERLPTPPAEEIIKITQADLEKLPASNWDIQRGVERNQAGAQSYVQKMNRLQKTAKPIDDQFARDELGYVFERQSPHWYHVTRTVANAYDRYKAPVIIYNSGGNHACLVLKIYQEGTDWKMVYWNPWSSGEKTKDLTETHELPINIKTMTKDEFEVLIHGTTNIDYVNFRNDNYLYAGGDILEEIYNGGAEWYDLTLEGDRELADPVIAAKNAQLQPDTDAQNCVLNSMWNFMVRARTKWQEKDRPTEMDEFFKFGLWKFMDDAEVYIESREELLKRQQTSA